MLGSLCTKGVGLNLKILTAISVLASVLFLLLADINQRTLSNYFSIERDLQFKQLNHNFVSDTQRLVGELHSLVYAMLIDSQQRMQPLDVTREKLADSWSQLRVNSAAKPSYMILMQEKGEFVDSWGYQRYDDDVLAFLAQPRTEAEFRVRCVTQCELVIAAPFKFDVGMSVIREITIGFGVPLSSLLASLDTSNEYELFMYTGAELANARLTAQVGRGEAVQAMISGLACDPLHDYCPLEVTGSAQVLRALPLPRASILGEQSVSVAIMLDIAEMKDALEQARWHYLLYSLLGILCLQILLYIMLRKPLTRVRLLSKTLPLLATSQFAEYRKRTANLLGGRWFGVADETDKLVTTSETLSAQLERMQAELLKHNARLAWLADHDPLTSLQNREAFLREASRSLKQSKQASVFFIDLDNFKFVNDFSGHQCGDELLVSAVNTMTSVIGERGMSARMGGDEFAFLLPGIEPNLAEIIGNRMLRAISRAMVSGPNKVHQASASLGVAHYPTHSDDLTELLAAADTAMYQAKQQGKNRLCVFQPEASGSDLKQRGYWLGQVAQAISGDRLRLAFQPIQKCVDGSISHYEVLLRFVDEQDSICSAYPLILAAEESGQIGKIDEWVMTQVVLLLHSVPAEQRNVSLAMNLSGRTFADERTLKRLYRLLERAGDLCQHLILEITETAALQNIQQAREVIAEFKAFGCRIAMDDFGVGFSSFHSLKELPVDYVKIDGSFVRELQNSQDDQVFVRALVDIARHFHYVTIAEFVENAELNQLLQDLGVDYCQGYHIGKPQLSLPPELCSESLAKANA